VDGWMGGRVDGWASGRVGEWEGVGWWQGKPETQNLKPSTSHS